MSRQDLELLRLRKEVDRLTYHTKEIPSRWAGGKSKVRKLLILDGNTVYTSGATTYYGVKRETTAITTVPSAYDPNDPSFPSPGDFTAIDGIGRATVYIDGVPQAGYVLVVHDSHSLHPSVMVGGDYPLAGEVVTLLVGAGPATVTAYRIDFP